MNDKIPSTTEAESAGFPPYGTGLKTFSFMWTDKLGVAITEAAPNAVTP
jgi:hypothetical protein